MQFRTILAPALAATMAFAGAPAKASVVESGITFLEPSDFPAQVQPLVTELYNAGVPIVDGAKLTGAAADTCATKDGSILFGFYDPQQNFMLLCTQNMDETLLLQTLVHEAVHVIQDCRVGLDNDKLEVGAGTKKLWGEISDSHKYDIVSLYPREQWLAEVEARYFEDSPAAVTTGMQQFCF